MDPNIRRHLLLANVKLSARNPRMAREWFSKLEKAMVALERICEIDGPGCDLSPGGPCYEIAKSTLDAIRSHKH